MFKGTNGGLSTSPCRNDEYTAAIDIVTDPQTPHYQLSAEEKKMGLPNKFKEEIQEYFMDSTNKLNAKPHWGKALPIANYSKLYGKDFQEFINAANEWYQDTGSTLATSSFINPFFEQIFNIKKPTEPIREFHLNRPTVNLFENPVASTDRTETTINNEEQFARLREDLNEIQKQMSERRYIHPIQPQVNMAMSLENDQFRLEENDATPYIGLFNRAGDELTYQQQINEVRRRANEFINEARNILENPSLTNSSRLI